MQVRTGVSIDLINVIQALVIMGLVADHLVRASDAGASAWRRENLVQRHHQGLGLLYLLGGMGLGWWGTR